jgi:hypothetical protein
MFIGCDYHPGMQQIAMMDNRCRGVLSGALLRALSPLLEQIEQLSEQIKQYDRAILEMSRVSHPRNKGTSNSARCGPGNRPHLCLKT